MALSFSLYENKLREIFQCSVFCKQVFSGAWQLSSLFRLFCFIQFSYAMCKNVAVGMTCKDWGEKISLSTGLDTDTTQFPISHLSIVSKDATVHLMFCSVLHSSTLRIITACKIFGFTSQRQKHQNMWHYITKLCSLQHSHLFFQVLSHHLSSSCSSYLGQLPYSTVHTAQPGSSIMPTPISFIQ